MFIFRIFIISLFMMYFMQLWADDTITPSKYLLKPTGKYQVGFQDFRIVNGTKTSDSYFCPGKTDSLYVKGQNENDFGADNQVNFCREMMVRVYYPAIKQKSIKFEKYYLPAINNLQNSMRNLKIPGVTENDLTSLEEIETFTIKNPKIVNKKFPVLIFDPGAGVDAQEYVNILSNLVSHGYVILALNNTFIGNSILFPDGRIVHGLNSIRAQLINADNSVLNDILFVREQLNLKKDNYFKFN